MDAHNELVIVGVDRRNHDANVLALGQWLQAAFGGKLLLAHVVPPAPPGRGMVQYESIS